MRRTEEASLQYQWQQGAPAVQHCLQLAGSRITLLLPCERKQLYQASDAFSEVWSTKQTSWHENLHIGGAAGRRAAVAGGAVRSMRWAAGQLYPALGRHPCKQTVAVAANQPTVARVEQALDEAPALQTSSLLCLAFAMLATGCTALRRSA